MNTHEVNIPTLEFPFINENGFSTSIHPWHRPDLVIWKQEPLPSFIGSPAERPITPVSECCCEGFSGFSGGFTSSPNIPTVPEASTWTMIVLGMCVIMMVKKWGNYEN